MSIAPTALVAGAAGIAPHSTVGILVIIESKRLTRRAVSPDRAAGLYTTQIFILDLTASTNDFISSLEIPVCLRLEEKSVGSPSSPAKPFVSASTA